MGENGYRACTKSRTSRLPRKYSSSAPKSTSLRGRWTVIETLAPEKLTSLRRIATIESVGSSTRIEGARLSDAEVEKLLSGLRSESFASRDEQEVAGYADAMDMIFDGYESITTTENHIKQLHGLLLKYSAKNLDHPGG